MTEKLATLGAAIHKVLGEEGTDSERATIEHTADLTIEMEVEDLSKCVINRNGAGLGEEVSALGDHPLDNGESPSLARAQPWEGLDDQGCGLDHRGDGPRHEQRGDTGICCIETRHPKPACATRVIG